MAPSLVASTAGIVLLSLLATGVFGTIGAALFIAATGILILLAPKTAIADLARFAPLLLLPFLALISTMWSDAPERTLRAGLQLTLTCVAAIIVCNRLRPSLLIHLLFWGFVGTCLLMLPGVPAAITQGTPLGSTLLGSKNQVGFSGHMLIALGLAVASDREQHIAVRLSTLPAFGLALLVLVLSQSAGAKTSLAVTLIIFPALLLFGRVKITLRVGIILIAIALGAIALIYLPDIQASWADFRLNVLKKDATLTGRTYLWSVAARLNAERPWLGRGYYAFWRPGNIDAEGLWRWGGIHQRNGFNFHNAFVEMQVDLGWIGLALFIATCVGIGAVGFARQFMRPSVPMAFLLSLLAVVYARSYSESGLIAPFSLLTLLWIGTAIYAFEAMPDSKVDGEIERPILAGSRPRLILRQPRHV